MKFSVLKILSICATCLLLGTACQQQAYNAAVAKQGERLEHMQQSVKSAEKAEIRILLMHGHKKITLPVPPAQLAQLKEILSHLQAVPPAMGERYFTHALWLAYADICLLGADGKTPDCRISIINPKSIMAESAAKKLSHKRSQHPYEAAYYLPDAALAELDALPIVVQARRIAEE